MTELPNRSHALEVLEATTARARLGHGRCAVLMLDLDRFKEIKDTLGYAFGDDEGDLLARLGGDEFMVVLEGADEIAALRRGLALAASLDAPFALPRTQVSLDASIGAAVFPDHAGDAATLLRRADIAMYQAKQEHSGVAIYQDGHDERYMHQVNLMSALRTAVEHDELHVAFQPKVDLSTRKVEHVEALLRWQHPEFGSVGPDEFIPLAERSGLIHELTRFVLNESLHQAGPWIRAGRIAGVAVNLSPLELTDRKLPEFVAACLSRHHVDPEHLVLEVTESTVMRDLPASMATMQRLRKLGISLSIDDFGTGHSSLAQVRSLPVQEIKIDKSFIAMLGDAGDAGDDSVIVRSAIEIGHNMGLSVIAESVEHAASLDILRELGCDMVQGFVFTKPLAAADYVGWHDRYLQDNAILDTYHGMPA